MPDPDPWSAGIIRQHLSFDLDDPIEVLFRARCDDNRLIRVVINQAHAPHKNMGLYGEAKLTRQWTEFTYRGRCTLQDENGQFGFFVGDSNIGFEIEDLIIRRAGLRVWLDNEK